MSQTIEPGLLGLNPRSALGSCVMLGESLNISED